MSRKAVRPGKPGFSHFAFPVDGPARSVPTKDLVGSKAHNLMVMASHDLPVPPGFVLSTDLCRAYMRDGRSVLEGLETVLRAELEQVSRRVGRDFGDAKRPLLVSVRSGAAVSMPGMMETVLNVGLNEATAQGLLRLTGNPRLMLDCRRRLYAQYAEVVHGADPKPFEDVVAARLAADGLRDIHELDSEGLAAVVAASAELCASSGGLPSEPMAQLIATIEAVLKSWMSERAISYRRMNGIDDEAGTAAIVQAMVFGNSGPISGSGVGFTRSPADGAKALYVDYLPNAQGEDVVAGRRNAFGLEELSQRVPEAFRDLQGACETLERVFGDMQDFEFTVEGGRLFLLQARSGKRTPLAALRIACDLVAEKRISRAQGLELLANVDVEAIEKEELAVPPNLAPLARAVPASTGVASGIAVFDPERIPGLLKRARPLILIREHAETSDIAALTHCAGLLTAHGARTSHAAVVARQLGKPCLVACATLRIAASQREARFGETHLKEGDALSLDAAAGLVFAGDHPVHRHRPTELLATIKSWRKAVAAR